jgi:hypothetical protein
MAAKSVSPGRARVETCFVGARAAGGAFSEKQQRHGAGEEAAEREAEREIKSHRRTPRFKMPSPRPNATAINIG